jgi:hypothetical protein
MPTTMVQSCSTWGTQQRQRDLSYYCIKSFFSMAMPDPTLQELLMKSCNSIGGNFFYICPIVLTCPPVTITCLGQEKDTKVSTLLWAQMFRKQSHCDVNDSHRTSTYVVLTDSWNCGMPVWTSMRHIPDNLIIRLRGAHSLLIQQTTLI